MTNILTPCLRVLVYLAALGLGGAGFTQLHSAPILRIPLHAIDFPYEGSRFIRDGQWLRVDTARFSSAGVSMQVNVPPSRYDVTLHAVGENDGRPEYKVFHNNEMLGRFKTPLSEQTTEEGERFTFTWNDVVVAEGDTFKVEAVADSADGTDMAHGRWSRLVLSRPAAELERTFADSTYETGVYGELKKWHKVTLAFEGPETSERANPNPFTDYRLDVDFRHEESGRSFRVPGFYAADGIAAETGGESGTIWRAHFSPDETGRWTWKASFRTGENVAMHEDDRFSQPVGFHGAAGEFTVKETDKTSLDFRARGRLNHVGRRYLQFAETGEYFIKGGADSPENFLAYAGFDGPRAIHDQLHEARAGEAAESPLHRYEPHLKDWKAGDPVWHLQKGKSIIGALNYLASKGMNSVYFLTMNVEGDGNDVWPWTSQDERFRFDCGKLDQWEIVFDHMDRLGLAMHVITQETENDQLLDSGALGLQRKLYYREMIARFAHHPALVWNLGEENTNTDRQRLQFSQYIHDLDPYDHPVVVHTYPGQYDKVYDPLLGVASFQGPSLQMGDMKRTHSETVKWLDRSQTAGYQWMVCLDEIGPADTGVKPDAEDYWHDEVRHHALWGNLMAGGAGAEWYFGYQYAHNDLNCEDWRSRDHMWDLTRIALDFFRVYLPFPEMRHDDELTAAANDYCFAKRGEVYAVYLPQGRATSIDLTHTRNTFEVKWFNPRSGNALQNGNVRRVAGGANNVTLGNPPVDDGKDWVALLRRVD